MVSCVVIDDNQDIVDVFCDLLDMINVDVLATGNDGKDAVELYEKHSPDIVFTDLQMPEYDGFYAVENIKDKNPAAKIIAVTGNPDAKDSPLLNSLSIPVVNKPFDVSAIKQSMNDVFLAGDDSAMPFEIQYKFKDDYNTYSCVATFEQYMNLKKLPIIEECKIINDTQTAESPSKEMQKALDLASENDTAYIRKISEVVG